MPALIVPFPTATAVYRLRRGQRPEHMKIRPPLAIASVLLIAYLAASTSAQINMPKANFTHEVAEISDRAAAIPGVRSRPIVVVFPTGERWNPVAPAIAAELSARGFDVRIPNREEPIRPDPLWWRETPADAPYLEIEVRIGDAIGTNPVASPEREMKFVSEPFSEPIQGSVEGFDLVIYQRLK